MGYVWAIKWEIDFKILLVTESQPVEFEFLSFFIICFVFWIVIGGIISFSLTLDLRFCRISIGLILSLANEFLMSLIFLM